jgi:ABC-type bacteriocin/lantibiotic exporter with double-glycine peptidase domain
MAQSFLGGKYKKIALARAILQDKQIIILDEATSNIDRQTVEIIKKLINTHFREHTIICISHTPEIIDLFSKEIALGKNGFEVIDRSN